MKALDKIYISSVFGTSSLDTNQKEQAPEFESDEVPQKVLLLKNRDIQFDYVKSYRPNLSSEKWYNQFQNKRRKK